jgi:hypothetical protein
MGCVCILIFATRAATAQPSADSARRSGVIVAPRVDIVLNGSAEDGHALDESLREMLQRIGLDLRLAVVDQFTPAEPWQAVSPEVVVRVWIDARQPDGALITLSDRRSGRTGAPRLVPRRGSRGLLLEETALVVHADTESLLSEPTPSAVAVGAQPLPAADTAPAEGRSPAKPSLQQLAWTLDAMTFAEGQSFAKDAGVVFGAGAGGRLHLGDNAWYPSLWLIGAFHLPFGQSQLPVQLTANVWSGRFVPTWRTTGGDLLTLEAGLGVGADVFVISPGATEGVGQLSAKRTDVSPIAASLLALHIAVSPTTRFTAAATLDWDLNPRRYIAVNGAAREALIQPFSFRPGLTLGISFEIAHAGVAR